MPLRGEERLRNEVLKEIKISDGCRQEEIWGETDFVVLGHQGETLVRLELKKLLE